MKPKEIILGIVFGVLVGIVSCIINVAAMQSTQAEMYPSHIHFLSTFSGVLSTFLGIAIARVGDK